MLLKFYELFYKSLLTGVSEEIDLLIPIFIRIFAFAILKLHSLKS